MYHALNIKKLSLSPGEFSLRRIRQAAVSNWDTYPGNCKYTRPASIFTG